MPLLCVLSSAMAWLTSFGPHDRAQRVARADRRSRLYIKLSSARLRRECAKGHFDACRAVYDDAYLAEVDQKRLSQCERPWCDLLGTASLSIVDGPLHLSGQHVVLGELGENLPLGRARRQIADRHLGYTSHSGRRTFITNAARRISMVGGSLKDVQELAGHTNIRTTQRYIDANPECRLG